MTAFLALCEEGRHRRAIGDLDPAHVALLKRAHESSFYGCLVVKDITRSLLSELIARGFMERTEDQPSLRSDESLLEQLKDERERGDRWAKYSLTPLGRRFVHYLRGTSPTPHEPGGYVLKNPDPLP